MLPCAPSEVNVTAIVEGLKYVADLLLEFAIPAFHRFAQRRRNLGLAQWQADIQVLNARVQTEMAKAELLNARATKTRAETLLLLEQTYANRHLDEIAGVYIDHPIPEDDTERGRGETED